MLIQLLIIQIVTFIALIFVLRFLSTRHLNGALTRLNTLHEENLVKESQLTDELKRAHEEREAEIKRGKEEADQIIEEAKKDALNLRKKIEEEARQEADKIIVQGKDEMLKIKSQFGLEMKNQSVEFAVKLIEQIFAEKNKQELQHQFINDIIEEIGQIERERFTVSLGRIDIASSSALQDTQRHNLIKVLEEKLGRPAQLNESVNAELICGLTVDIGGFVIDGSLRNRLRRAIALIIKET